jgi:hypothetical protein
MISESDYDAASCLLSLWELQSAPRKETQAIEKATRDMNVHNRLQSAATKKRSTVNSKSNKRKEYP